MSGLGTSHITSSPVNGGLQKSEPVEQSTHAPTHLQNSIDNFLEEGFDSVMEIVKSLGKLELPHEMRILLLRVFGAYLNTFNSARREHGLSIETAHLCANNTVLGDAHVIKLFEKLMNQGVTTIVSRAVQ